MNIRISIVILLFSMVGLVVGCSTTAGETPELTVVNSIETEVFTQEPVIDTEQQPYPYPYPAPTQYILPTQRVYPEPQSAAPTSTLQPFFVPTAEKDMGVVVGKLVDTETKSPLAFQMVYLGTLIPLTPGPGYNYALQEKSSPHTMTDDDGNFALGSVAPGTYIILLFHPINATVIMEPNSDKELKVSVSAGNITELGEIEGVNPLPQDQSQ